MAEIERNENDETEAILDAQTLRLIRLDNFLALRGILANDNAFDEAIKQIEQLWRSWPAITSIE